jgi:FkbM family methyltransferase
MKILSCGAAVVDGDQAHAKWVEMSGRLDHDSSLNLILPLIHAGDIVVDAGANIGTHTVAYARQVGQAGHVFAFEPNYEAFECLAYNVGKQHIVSLYNFALGRELTFGSMAIDQTNAGASHMVNQVDGNIEVRPLDSMGMRCLDFLKIDVEGYETEVLAGAQATIMRCRPIMLIEVNDGALRRFGRTGDELIVQIRAMGYDVANVFADLPMNGPQFDVICKPL